MAKEKYPKERPPGYRFILRASLLSGAVKRDSCPFVNARHPCRAPDGLILLKAPVLGAVNGISTCLPINIS